jgi:hypothetical protein
MCEDNVVARVVLAATARRGGAGETEFEDHVGGYVGVVGVWYSYAMQWLWLSPSRWPDSYNLRRRRFVERFRVRVRKLRPRFMYATWGSEGALET